MLRVACGAIESHQVRDVQEALFGQLIDGNRSEESIQSQNWSG